MSPELREKLRSLRTTLPMPSIIVSGQMFLTGDDGFGRDNKMRKLYRKIAQHSGVSPEGKRYIPSLAEHPADPNAWCSDESELRAKCRAKGYGLRGRMSMDAADRCEPINGVDTPYKVAPDVVEKELKMIERATGEKFVGKRRKEKRRELSHTLTGAMNDPVPSGSLGD